MMPAADQIKAERNRQIMSEGYTEKVDRGRSEELVNAATAYLLDYAGAAGQDIDAYWPWNYQHYKPDSGTRTLIKAAALLAAAIDSINNSKDTDK